MRSPCDSYTIEAFYKLCCRSSRSAADAPADGSEEAEAGISRESLHTGLKHINEDWDLCSTALDDIWAQFDSNGDGKRAPNAPNAPKAPVLASPASRYLLDRASAVRGTALIWMLLLRFRLYTRARCVPRVHANRGRYFWHGV